MPLLAAVPGCRFSKIGHCGKNGVPGLDIFGQVLGIIELLILTQGISTLLYVNYVKRAKVAGDRMMAGGGPTHGLNTPLTQLEWFLIVLITCTACGAISTTTSSFVGMPSLPYFMMFAFMEFLAYLSMLVYVDMVLRTTTTPNKSLNKLRTFWLRLLVIPAFLTTIVVIVSGTLSESDDNSQNVPGVGELEAASILLTILGFFALLILLYHGRSAFKTYLLQAEQVANSTLPSGLSSNSSSSQLHENAYPPAIVVVDYAKDPGTFNKNSTSFDYKPYPVNAIAATTSVNFQTSTAPGNFFQNSNNNTNHPIYSSAPVNSPRHQSTGPAPVMVNYANLSSNEGSQARSRSESVSAPTTTSSAAARRRPDALVTAIKSAIQTLNWLLTIAWFVTGYTFVFNLILFVIGLGGPLYFVTMFVYGMPAILSSAVYFVVAKQTYSKWLDMNESA